MAQSIVKVIVDAPLRGQLDYKNVPELGLRVGERCIVPLGRRNVIGIVAGFSDSSEWPVNKLRKVAGRPDEIAPLSENWMRLTAFAARYYLSRHGMVAVPALPKFFRRIPGPNYANSLSKLRDRKFKSNDAPEDIPLLNKEQEAIVDDFSQSKGFSPALLFGVTGSGKTEVYLRLIENTFKADPKAQILLMVPEINLTPQLVSRIGNRFKDRVVATWNSSMAEGQKASSWLACHEERASILVGTRLSVFASLPNLKLIIVDEEHDASYKSHEGVRYNARDLALKRAQIEGIPVLLGSATPSLESYRNALEGRFRLYKMKKRAVESAELPRITLIDTSLDRPQNGICSETAEKITDTLEKGRQSIVFLNRRGFAPVVECKSCGWHSTCPHCSAYAVFHKTTGRLTCHYCGWSMKLPTSCPKCGSYELQPVGRGTQRAEEELEVKWPEAKIMRLDQDSARRRGSASRMLEAVHSGEVDILIGTQIVAKGHDFKKVSLVVVLNTDPQLLSFDYRARERLFSVLMQVAGRAGRSGEQGEVLIQTKYPKDSLFRYLKDNDFEGFAQEELKARKTASMTPYSAQALMISEGKDIREVLDFLSQVKKIGLSVQTRSVRFYDPVPQTVQKVMDIERAQLLIEADNKMELQRFLAVFTSEIENRQFKNVWHIDVDPLSF